MKLALAFIRLGKADRAYDLHAWIKDPESMEAQRAEYHAAWAHMLACWDEKYR